MHQIGQPMTHPPYFEKLISLPIFYTYTLWLHLLSTTEVLRTICNQPLDRQRP